MIANTPMENRNTVNPKLPRPFNRLQWKLTLSYTLVTLFVILGLQALALLYVMANIENEVEALLRSELESAAPGVSILLNDNEVGSEDLLLWLEILNSFPDDESEVNFDFDYQLRLSILNPEGKVLVSDDPAQKTGQPFDARFPAENETIVTATQGDTEIQRTSTGNQQWHFLAATPVIQAGELDGLLIAEIEVDARDIQITNFSSALLSTLLIALVLAGFAGLISGFIHARWLTRRLDKLEQQAAQWSQGNLTSLSEEQSTDELGDLARRFNEMAAQLNLLMQTRQTLAVMEERNRLARDLHDSIKQHTFAISMLVNTAQGLLGSQPEAARERLDQAEKLIYLVQKETENLVYELRPLELEEKALPAALKDYLDDWAKIQQIPVEANLMEDIKLPPLAQYTLFRVAQETLANIARHSRATQVRVELAPQNEHTCLSIQDNGIGFDLEKSGEKGLGLRTMNERVVLIGGQLAIESAPEQGTCIRACVPHTKEQE
jgi:NarL family two-component system sensor histidine kinase LiaS